jgi:exonuclease SbcC
LSYPAEFLTKNPVLYRYTVYTPQEEMKHILLEDKEDRLNTLRRVFGVDNYKKIITNVEIADKKLREIAKGKEGFISDLDSKRKDLENKKKNKDRIRLEAEKILPEVLMFRRTVEEKKKNLEEIEGKITDLSRTKSEIASIKVELREKRNSIRVNEEEILGIDDYLTRVQEEFKKENVNVENLEDSAEKITAGMGLIEKEQDELKKNQIIIERKIASLEFNRQHREKVNADILKLNTCPTCKQTVSEEYKKEIEERTNAELKTVIENLETENKIKQDIEEKLNVVREKLRELAKKEKEISLYSFKIRNFDEKKARKQKLLEYNQKFNVDITALAEREVVLNEKVESSKDLDDHYKIAKKMLEEERTKERAVEIKKAELEQELKSYSEIIAEMEDEIAEKEIEREKVIYVNKVRDWISDQFIPLIMFIEQNIMNRVQQDFSKLFQKWFSMLVGDLNASLDNDFSPVIEQSGYQINYEYLSGGERTAAALAYRLALNQVINSLMSHIKTRELIILDEPTDGFSSEQLDKMRSVLNELKVKQLILVSHESKMEEFVQHIIRFDKKEFTTVK